MKPRRKRRKAGRRLRTGIYCDGGKTLFVPMLEMFDVRHHVKARRIDGARSVRASLRAAPVGRGAVTSWLELFADLSWFRPWLLEGLVPPGDVHVPTRSEVERMLRACSYSSLMEGVSPRGRDEYTRFLGKGPRLGFPVRQIGQWMNWLYGGPAPEGWLIVDELTVAVRNQLNRTAICGEAGIKLSTFTRWKADEGARAALAAAVARRSAGGREPVDCEAWDSLAKKSKAAMLKWAAAATEARALERAKNQDSSLSGNLTALRVHARSLGLKESLEAYVNEFIRRIPEPPSERPAKGMWARRGEVSPKLFVPLPWMRKFIARARATWHANQIGMIQRGTLPKTRCWELWFLDWAIPLEARRSKSIADYRSEAGLVRPDGRSPWRTAKPVLASESPDATGGEGTAETERGPMGRGDLHSRAQLDGERLAAALAAVGSDARYEQQRALVTATAELTVGKRKHWALAKEISRRAGVGNSTNISVALNKLAKRGALRKKPSGHGYRLP